MRCRGPRERLSESPHIDYRRGRAFSCIHGVFIHWQVMLNVFVTVRLKMLRGTLFEHWHLLRRGCLTETPSQLACISVRVCLCLVSMVNALSPMNVRQLFLCIFSVFYFSKFAVFRPKYGFTFVVIRLRCIDCQKLEVRTTGIGVKTEDFILSLVIQCYQVSDGFMLRLTWIFLVRFYSVISAVWECETANNAVSTCNLFVMRYAHSHHPFSFSCPDY